MRCRSLFLSILLLCAGGSLLAGEKPLRVVVSILPQKHFVEQLGGERVQVTVMVGPGQNPASYEPTPRQMTAVATADLIYRMGVPFEEAWMKAVAAAGSRASLLDARDGVMLREMEPPGGHHHDYDPHSHEADRPDPHIWLSPRRVRVMMGRLLERLIHLDPGHEERFRENHRRFDRQLQQLEEEIRRRLAPATDRSFMVFHPSWGYFAEDFGLRQIPIQSGARETGARGLARLVEQGRSQNIRTIFVQPQFSQRQARMLAKTLNGRVVPIDPLAEDFQENLRRVAGAIAEGIQ